MNEKYDPELKQSIIRLYLEDGRTMKSLTEEYKLGKGTLVINNKLQRIFLCGIFISLIQLIESLELFYL